MKFTVEGMHCGHCVRAITRAIYALNADARVEVDLTAGTVVVTGDLGAEQAATAIAAEGYAVTATAPA
jgi:copper chaperone